MKRKLVDTVSFINALKNAGGYDADPGSFDDGFNQGLEEALKILEEMPAAAEPAPKLALTIKEMARSLSIGLPAAYELVHIEGFPVITLGKKKLIVPVAKLEEWLASTAGKEALLSKRTVG